MNASRGGAPYTVKSRGYLSHIEAPGRIQAVTFRLGDSLPVDISFANTRRIAQLLDKGLGACYLGRSEIAELVENALLHFEGDRYDLHAWVIMPNHVHVVVAPHEGFPLSSILHSWKGRATPPRWQTGCSGGVVLSGNGNLSTG